MRVGADAGGEEGAVHDVEVVEVVELAVAVGDALLGVVTHRAAAHDVCAAYRCFVRGHVELSDGGFGFFPRHIVLGLLVRGPRGLGTGCELHLEHRVVSAAHVVQEVAVDRIVEGGLPLVVDLDRPALALLVEAVAHEGDHALGVVELVHAIRDLLARGAVEPCRKGWLQRRHLQLESDWTRMDVLPLEVV